MILKSFAENILVILYKIDLLCRKQTKMGSSINVYNLHPAVCFAAR